MNTPTQTPLQMIASERESAIAKGRTPETDYKTYKKFELKEIAVALISSKAKFPDSLPKEYGARLLKKPYRERLAIAGQFLIAEMEWLELDELAKAPTPEEIDKQIAELKAKRESLLNRTANPQLQADDRQ